MWVTLRPVARGMVSAGRMLAPPSVKVRTRLGMPGRSPRSTVSTDRAASIAAARFVRPPPKRTW